MSLVATLALLVGVLLLHPAVQLDAARRLVGLGPERVLAAPAVVDRGGTYAFAMTQPGSDEPVGWDPCHEVAYAVNPAGMPEGGRDLVDRALTRLTAATGLAFRDEGDTDKRPFTGSFVPFGSARPVVIGWGDPTEFPELAGDVAGIGGAAAEDGSAGRRYYVTGGVALDTEAFTADVISTRPQVMEAIVLHELAHVVGLDHVAEPMELMYTSNTGQVELGPGDREGLARLGSLPCG